MKKILQSIHKHLLFWGENYIALPLILIFLVLSIYGVNFLTGRPVVDDIGAVVGMLINAVGIALSATLAGLLQHYLFGYRSNKSTATIWDDIHDSVITLLLLALFCYRIFN
jgi:hypothetical protein